MVAFVKNSEGILTRVKVYVSHTVALVTTGCDLRQHPAHFSIYHEEKVVDAPCAQCDQHSNNMEVSYRGSRKVKEPYKKTVLCATGKCISCALSNESRQGQRGQLPNQDRAEGEVVGPVNSSVRMDWPSTSPYNTHVASATVPEAMYVRCANPLSSAT